MDSSSGWNRAIGLIMIAASVGVVVAMGHHPSGAHGGPLGAIVHGAMIGLLLLWTWGFFHFARGIGVERPLVLAGIITYSVSAFAHLVAATINGFVVPALAERHVSSHDLFLFAWLTNQAFAKVGVYMTGIAYTCWSAELLRDQTRPKWLGAIGLICGFVPVLLLASGAIDLRVGGAFIVYTVHSVWAALVGVALLKRSRSAGSE